MSVDDVVAVFVKQIGTGAIWECALIGPPTRYWWRSGALLTARQAHLTQAGVPWKDMGRTDHVEEYGVPVTEPPPPAAYLTAVQVWAGKVDDADPKHGPMDAGTTLATMAWRVLALQAQVAALDEAVWAGSVQVADKLHGPMPAGSTLATMAWRISDLVAAVARIEAALAPPVPPVTPVVTVSSAQPPVVTSTHAAAP